MSPTFSSFFCGPKLLLALLTGLNHLLYPENRGDNEIREDEKISELRVACFMGLVSFLSGRAEVLRVEPRLKTRLLNAAARSMIQSATLTEEPLTAAGLDGTGEVIQVRRSHAGGRGRGGVLVSLNSHISDIDHNLLLVE